MGMAQAISLLGWSLAVWLAALALILCIKGAAFLDALRHLISSDLDSVSKGRIDPARVQLAAVTALAAVIFIVRAWHAITGPDHRMPEIPDGLLTLVTGSHAVYLSGRVGHSLISRREDT
jgi:hypothetical protein